MDININIAKTKKNIKDLRINRRRLMANMPLFSLKNKHVLSNDLGLRSWYLL